MMQAHQANVSTYQGYQVAPEGLLTYFRSQELGEYTLAEVEKSLPRLKESVDSLVKSGVQRIVMGGVPIGAALGRGKALEILGKISDWAPGVQVSSSFEDHIAAYQALGVTRIALADRWPEEINLAVKAYLEAAGLELLAYRYGGKGLQENKTKSPEADHETALTLGRAVLEDAPDAEVLMLPGGNGFFLYAAPQLEQELGIPVVTNHTASVFGALNNYEGDLPVRPDERWGRLLQSL